MVEWLKSWQEHVVVNKIDQIRNRVSGYIEVIESPETPWSAKLLLIAAIAYFLSPIDLIPDFIPIIGYLDDLIIVPLLIWLAFRQIEAARVKNESRKAIVANADSSSTNHREGSL